MPSLVFGSSCLATLPDSLPVVLFPFARLSGTGICRARSGEEHIQCFLKGLLLGIAVVAPCPASMHVVPQLLQVAPAEHKCLPDPALLRSRP